ncbi:hypothetical protein C0Q70_15707 [Pomacea canaliculata]|uniref:Uncharacterized protein n=1 Tax=Pomacea canaliculata TaxID=400727 RepID=A0A2T7NVK9_POMCA|nr:hypothetical protein C0Q70_15707 [Pomacea canaliculata]
MRCEVILTIRSCCLSSSYMDAMTCISRLKEECPESKHPQIDRSLTNLHGGRDALDDLCTDDRIIEVYARHQSCFTEAGPSSERCLSRKFNVSIKLLANVNTEPKDKFCSDMRSALTCVQNKVKQMCSSEEAVELAAILVKPMIRDSTNCVYSTVTKPPDAGQNDRPSVDTHSAHDGSQYKGRTTSGAAMTPRTPCRQPLLLLLVLLVIRTMVTMS